MEGERRGSEEHRRSGGHTRRAMVTIRDNSTAFGFSLTVTMSFGLLQTVARSPSVGEIVAFGVAAAAVVGMLEALATRGFRSAPPQPPPEVIMLGTALDFVSVAAGAGAALAVAELVEGFAAWPLAAAAAAFVFLATESLELAVAAWIQRRRGRPAG